MFQPSIKPINSVLKHYSNVCILKQMFLIFITSRAIFKNNKLIKEPAQLPTSCILLPMDVSYWVLSQHIDRIVGISSRSVNYLTIITII